MPEEPGADPTRAQDMIYTEKVKQFVKREATLISNLATIHSVIWGQCSEAMKARVGTLTDYRTRADANNCLWLLRQIKAITLQFNEKRNGIMSFLEARANLLNCRQQHGQTVTVFKEILKGWADATWRLGGGADQHGCTTRRRW